MSSTSYETEERKLAVKQLLDEFAIRFGKGDKKEIATFISQNSKYEKELKLHFTGGDHISNSFENANEFNTEVIATSQTSPEKGSDSEKSIPEKFGRYEIQKVLGMGAMGAVYLAKDSQLDRNVALKIPKFGEHGVKDEELLTRFYREARASATLRSPYICPVYDVGEIDGQHYITMAYIEGRLLKDFTKSKRIHPEKHIASTIWKLATGLAEAHSIGVIHRDLKPANIMVDTKGVPVVMDFGLARRSASDDVQVTHSGAILGTPAYMAPEQVAGKQSAINHKVDIYALGIIMYELITGEMPFKGNLMTILQQIAISKPKKPSENRTSIDPRLEAICLKMMAGKQKKRYQSMDAVAADLQKIIRNPGILQVNEPATNLGPKPSSMPSPLEESNPALISVEESKPFAEQLRNKKAKNSTRSRSRNRVKGTSNSEQLIKSKSLLFAGVCGIVILLILSFSLKEKTYEVNITIDDPQITLTIDGEKLSFDKGINTYKLPAGRHRIRIQKDGFRTQIENITVLQDRKTELKVVESKGVLTAVSLDEFDASTLAKRHPHKPVVSSDSLLSADSVENKTDVENHVEVELVEKQRQNSESELNDSDVATGEFDSVYSGMPIDLLSQLSQDGVLEGKVTPHKNGSWVFWNRGLIHLPMNINEGYRLSVDFEHTAGKSGTVSLIVPVGSSYVEVFTSTTQPDIGTGIQMVSGQNSLDNGTHNPKKQFKRLGRVVFSVDVFRKESKIQIRCLINDQVVTEKRLSENSLSLRDIHQNFPRNGIGVECKGESNFVIRKIDLLTDSMGNNSK